MSGNTINVAAPNPGAVVKSEKTDGERFAELMLKEFGVAGIPDVTERERSLINGYFMGISRAISAAETRRLKGNEYAKKNKKATNDLQYTWKNIDMSALASDLVPYARMGIDMTIRNHLNAIPYKNSAKTKYVMTFIDGYAGLEYITKKYALDEIKNVYTELVYETDTFQIIKKDRDNAVETYVFQINNPHERGEIVGGFSYIEYSDPTKNKLVHLTRAHIEKRKPKKAAAEFWGGIKTEWVKNEQTGRNEPIEVEMDGWLAEMCLKTIKRETYTENKHIAIDPMKVDGNYRDWKAAEIRMAEYEVVAEIADNANIVPFDAPPPPPVQAINPTEPKASEENAEAIRKRNAELDAKIAAMDNANDANGGGNLFDGEPSVGF